MCSFNEFSQSCETYVTSSAPDNVKGNSEHLKGIPLPPNPAQVPNPIQPHHAKDQIPAEPVHHRQSEFPHTLTKELL